MATIRAASIERNQSTSSQASLLPKEASQPEAKGSKTTSEAASPVQISLPRTQALDPLKRDEPAQVIESLTKALASSETLAISHSELEVSRVLDLLKED